MNKSLTALMCSYVKFYVSKHSNIYQEPIIINQEEINLVSSNLIRGISFFNPNFTGTDEEILAEIINKQLGPSIIARSMFNERVINNEIKLGLKQYLLIASGYDTSALKYNLKSYEVDKVVMIEDKLKRVEANDLHQYINIDLEKELIEQSLLASDFNKDLKTHVSLLGITYYLPKESFAKILSSLDFILSHGSTIVFDYPNDFETENELKNKALANSANELMCAKYNYRELEELLSDHHFLIYEHLTYEDVNNTYFKNTELMASPGVNYCLAVKQ